MTKETHPSIPTNERGRRLWYAFDPSALTTVERCREALALVLDDVDAIETALDAADVGTCPREDAWFVRARAAWRAMLRARDALQRRIVELEKAEAAAERLARREAHEALVREAAERKAAARRAHEERLAAVSRWRREAEAWRAVAQRNLTPAEFERWHIDVCAEVQP